MKRLVYTLFGALFILYYICYQGVLSHVWGTERNVY